MAEPEGSYHPWPPDLLSFPQIQRELSAFRTGTIRAALSECLTGSMLPDLTKLKSSSSTCSLNACSTFLAQKNQGAA